ncbi:MAG TPA: VTT domain-containing protein [Ignavibacteria bacterium]
MEFLKDIFHQIYDVKSLVIWAGYAGMAFIIFAETGLLAGFFLPGDSLLVTAGLFAATPDPKTGNTYLDILILIPLLLPCAILGNSTGYLIGNKAGIRLFKKEQSLLFRKDYLLKTHEFYEKHGKFTIIIAQLMPIFRTFAPTVAGIGSMKFKDFIRYNVIGAIIWIPGMLLIGYYLGRAIPGIENHIEKVIIVVVFLSILPGIIKFLRHKLQKRKAASETVNS